MSNYIISIDMGGTKILAALINSKTGILTRVKKSTDISKGRGFYIKELVNIVDEVIKKGKIKKTEVKAVCLGIPGSVNPHTGVIGIAPNLGIKNFNIKNELQKKIAYPVLIENDVNLAGLGIKNFGWGKDATNMLVVFIGTGIGGALVFDGKIYRGSTFIAGEIGHMQIEKKGPLCGCGKRGCFETFASRTAIVKNIVNDIRNNKRTVLAKYYNNKKPIKSKALKFAVEKNDRLVLRHINDACEKIGTVIGSLTNLLNFDMIILGGGAIEALDYYMIPKIKEAFNKSVLEVASKKVIIKATKLGDDAALYGGISLAEEFLGIKI